MTNQDKRTVMGKMLTQVRKAHRLTQEQVADILKIKRSTYAYYERNITPTLENISRLSTLFSVSTHELMFGEPDPVTLRNLAPEVPGGFRTDASIFPTNNPENFGRLYERERILIGKFRLLSPELKDKLEQELENLLDKNDK